MVASVDRNRHTCDKTEKEVNLWANIVPFWKAEGSLKLRGHDGSVGMHYTTFSRYDATVAANLRPVIF